MAKRKQKEKPKIFISYNWNDSEFVAQIEDLLKVAGAEVWVDKTFVLPGDQVSEHVSEALEWCTTMLLFWSEAASNSAWVKLELSAAISLHKRIIPCLADDTEVPAILRGIVPMRFISNEQGITDLCRALGLHP